MYVRKVKRKCGVRGCKSIDSFAISETRESGNSVIICRNCLKNGLEAVEKFNIPESAHKEATQIPPLFFNNEAFDVNVPEENENEAFDVNESEENENEACDVNVPEENEAVGVKCPLCGKVFENEKGLAAHKRFCKGAE